ncbi:hypothetical protein M409DRAFT_65090 [Zasmidium cellare ATCC 36951]|uniref:FAD-binding PCMH-type domain-containing protein n=1 Tax=Zasmidium cellare ATCC 36951 TaxID=1080233 RepID=A0A6A6CQR9_ZASCE|nr:uncharacterized protein M409DRAFT_65090 [Zasmidium cellare ATCC 36951]KAF2169421.1 hypothetical protein M409DRAFT_65090 [Zasmidium cellare ATCC 36951]
MSITNDEIEELRQLCPNLYSRNDAVFPDKAAPWSIWADRNPQFANEPQDIETMQAVVKYLYSHKSIDFCVRNTGTGGASATDIVLSMHGFKELEFFPEDETVVAGAGLSWGELDQLMDQKTDGYGCVGARCTWVGVTGGPLVGGLSWLSHEYGLISDPQNWLDAEVVTGDGNCRWAVKEDPDLMWALRGGGGNFGVVTRLKLKAYKVPSKIFCGVILVPYSSLHEVSKALAAFDKRPSDPKIAMHIMNQGLGAGQTDQGSKPGIILMPIDFRGEAHARSEEGFGWAWKVTGAQEAVAMETTLTGVNALNDTFKAFQGRNEFWLAAPLVSEIDEEMLVRMWKWYEETYELHPGFGAGSVVLLEFMQEASFNSTSGPETTAFPHGRGQRHVLQTQLGCPPKSKTKAGGDSRELAMLRMSQAGKEIAKDAYTGEWHAGFLHDWSDLKEVYGPNYEKLKQVKRRYDPENRFNKGVNLTEGKITEWMTV